MNQIEHQYALEITEKLINNPLCLAFLSPISRDEEWSADYFAIIKKPMDLSTIKTNLENQSYESINEWKADVNQVWENAKIFNGKGSMLYVVADFLTKKCNNTYFAKIPRIEMDLTRNKIDKINKKIKELTSMEFPKMSISPRTPMM